MNIKKLLILVGVVGAMLYSALPAFAHVVVRPKEVGIAAFQTFTVGVPVEKEVATTGLRLVIPEGLKWVTPNVKPGWNISVQKEGEGDEMRVTEIVWTGGTIPPGQRDEFLFSAQVPSEKTAVIWKAYQTYADGEVVSWDKDPQTVEEYEKNNSSTTEGDDHNAPLPYSETTVVNDLAAADTVLDTNTLVDGSTQSSLPLLISSIALIGTGISLWMQLQKKKK